MRNRGFFSAMFPKRVDFLRAEVSVVRSGNITAICWGSSTRITGRAGGCAIWRAWFPRLAIDLPAWRERKPYRATQSTLPMSSSLSADSRWL